MLAIALLIALLGGPGEPPQISQPAFVAVVHESSPLAEISEERLSKLFLKKVRRWESGEPVLAVDQEAGTHVRDAFTSIVHRRSVQAVVAYWQQQIFSGNEVPPPVRHGDDAVLAFVRSNPTAIGYVSARVQLPSGVKALKLTH